MSVARHDVPLAPLTTLRLGGPARRLVEAATEADVVEAVREADAAGEPLLVLAGGSNVVIADEGFDGTVVRILTRGVERTGERLEVQAGEDWDTLVAACVGDGLAGFECLSGIPGSTGATPIQNVGAYGQDVSETVDRRARLRPGDARGHDARRRRLPLPLPLERVQARRPPGGALRGVQACGARRSPVPCATASWHGRSDVAPGEGAPLGAVREAVLGLRRGKGMVIDPADPDSVSAGSFFTNPILDREVFAALQARMGPERRPPAWPEPEGRVKTSAAWLIEQAGFRRGHGNGRAGISAKHTLALVNRGEASTEELLAVAREVAAGVREAFGVELMPEPVLVGEAW